MPLASKSQASASDIALIESVKSILAQVPEGKALLELSDHLGVPIFIAHDLEDTAQLAYKTDGTSSSRKILLAPNGDVRDIAVALGHELRHLWQYNRIGLDNTLILNLQDQMSLKRIMEGDAFAFQAYLEKTLSVAARITPVTDKEADIIKTGFKKKGFEQKESAPETKELTDAWLAAFLGFQFSHYGMIYDRDEIKQAEKISRLMTYARFFKQPPELVSALRSSFNQSAKDLRLAVEKITVAGLDDSSPSYFSLTESKKMLEAVSTFIDAGLRKKAARLNTKLVLKSQKIH